MKMYPFVNSLSRRVALHLNRAIGTILIVFALAWVSPVGAQSLPADARATCVVPASLFASWFQSGAVSLNGVVDPADSVTFPNTPNCSFYQWSEQMYLWLTSPAPSRYGSGKFVFDSPVFYDVSPPDKNQERTFLPHVSGKFNFTLRDGQVGPLGVPILFDRSGKMFHVNPPKIAPSGKPVIQGGLFGQTMEIHSAKLGQNGKPIFLNKAGKTIRFAKPIVQPKLKGRNAVQKFKIGDIAVFLDSSGKVINVEQGQAGGGDVLMAQNGSLVYYTTMVNDVYAYFLTGTKNGGITPTPTQFPTTTADLNKITTFALAHGKVFPDPNALAIAIKASWVEADGLPNLSSYITMNATIPTYNTSNPNQWIPNGQKTVKLAMVGIHVVGSTSGHPEMIWATFEHFGNTPHAAYSYVNTSNVTTTVPQSTAGTWLFSASNSGGPFNNAHMSFSSPNINSVQSPPPPFTISPSDTILWKPFGAASDFRPNPAVASSAASNTEIISINNSVLGQLVSGDIRANYYMVGSTWTIGGASPTGSFKAGTPGNEVGTSKLANSTMETYHQGSNTLWATGTNCFGCHTSNTTDVSHIFPELKPLF